MNAKLGKDMHNNWYELALALHGGRQVSEKTSSEMGEVIYITLESNLAILAITQWESPPLT